MARTDETQTRKAGLRCGPIPVVSLSRAVLRAVAMRLYAVYTLYAGEAVYGYPSVHGAVF